MDKKEIKKILEKDLPNYKRTIKKATIEHDVKTKPDSIMPDISILRKRYLGIDNKKKAQAKKSNPHSKKKLEKNRDTQVVYVEPKKGDSVRKMRQKATFVSKSKKKVIGVEG